MEYLELDLFAFSIPYFMTFHEIWPANEAPPPTSVCPLLILIDSVLVLFQSLTTVSINLILGLRSCNCSRYIFLPILFMLHSLHATKQYEPTSTGHRSFTFSFEFYLFSFLVPSFWQISSHLLEFSSRLSSPFSSRRSELEFGFLPLQWYFVIARDVFVIISIIRSVCGNSLSSHIRLLTCDIFSCYF